MFYKKAVHRNFAKFTGKYPSQSLFFNKVAILRSDLRSSQRRCSVREGIQEHLRWLLPNIYTGSTILLIWPSNIVRTRDPPSCSYDLQTLSGHGIHHPAHMTFKHCPDTGSTILLIWPSNIVRPPDPPSCSYDLETFWIVFVFFITFLWHNLKKWYFK